MIIILFVCEQQWFFKVGGSTITRQKTTENLL